MPAPRWYDPYMTPGEKLLWEGRSAGHAPVFCVEEGKSLLFLPFLGMGGFMLYTLATSSAPDWILMTFMTLLGVWVLGVLLNTLAPFLYRRWIQPELAYAVTDRRILRYRRGTVDALDIAHLPAGRVLPTREGCGTITFALDQPTTVRASGGGVRVSMSMPQDWLSSMLRTSIASLNSFDMYHIAEPDSVLALIRSATPSIPDMQPLSDAPLLPLDPGEKLLWQGRPERPPFGFDYDWMSLLPGLFILGVGVIGTGILSFGAAWIPIQLVFCLPLACGLYLLAGRAILERIQMRRTVIVVTDRRILRAVGSKVETFFPGETVRMGLFQGCDGCGSVILGDIWAAAASEEFRNRPMNACRAFQLPFVPDAARCMDAINALRKALTHDEA